MSRSRLQEVKNNGKSLYRQSKTVVAVAYMRWSFTTGSIQLYGFDWESFGVLNIKSLTRGNRKWRFDCIRFIIITITISSNLIGALTALFFSNHCVGL